MIDITGSGNNTLTLDYFDFLSLSDETNTKTIIGNAGDAVNIDLTGRGFTSSINGGFTEYTDGVSTLRISNAVDQTGVMI